MTAVAVDSWRTFDPEDLSSVFGDSLVKRARKRFDAGDVWQGGTMRFNRFIVNGRSSLGDAYDDYTVTFDGRRYHCSCRDHAYGEFRNLCSHALAVILFRKAHASGDRPAPTVPVERGDGDAESEPAGPPPVDEATHIPSPRGPMWGEPPLPEWVGELREHQWDAVEAIVAAYEGGENVVFCDAPTGSGKTLIGELVRRRLRTRAMYVCSTKTLQDQFLADFPYARVLKGRANYPTADHPEKFGQGWDALTAGECTKRLMDVPACATCSPREGRAMHCNWCHPVSECPYEKAKGEALRAEVAVLNTSYFLTEANAVGRFSGDVEDGEVASFGLVIVDEADLLESELMGQVEVRIGSTLQKRLEVEPPAKKTVEDSWVEWVSAEAIPKVERAIKKIPRTAEDPKKVKERQRLERLHGRLKVLEDGLGEGNWVYGGYADDEIVFRPVRVDRMGRDLLWRHSDRWLLMSATVIDPEEMATSLGLVTA